MSFFARLFGRKKDGEEGAEGAADGAPATAPSAPPQAAAPMSPAAPKPATSKAPEKVAAGGSTPSQRPSGKPVQVASASPAQVSNRPSAPAAGNGAGAKGEVLDAVLGNLDASFSAIFDDKGVGAAGRSDEADKVAMLELFYEIAANHLKPVRHFMTELSLGDARREWIAIARPAVESILSAAQQIGIPELEKRLSGFTQVFQQVEGSTAFMISGELRQSFLTHYQKLNQFMPKAFALGDGRDQNESLLTHSLLLQIPDVRKVTIDKLYRAGLSAAEVLFLATRDDLAATTGIRQLLAERIVDKFQSYRDQAAVIKKDSKTGRATELGKLATLLGELRQQHAQYENGQALSDGQKRGLRLSRQGTWLDITVTLAELGEADRVQALEKVNFEQKIKELETYLKQT